MPETIIVRLKGRDEAPPSVATLLHSAARSTGSADDDAEFLPDGYLKVTGAYDVGGAARSVAGGRTTDVGTAPDQVLVLELADGSTFITGAGRMRDALERNRPDLIGNDGAILFDDLRADGAAARGLVGDIVGGLVSKVYTLVVGATEPDSIIRAAQAKLAEWLGTKAEAGLADLAQIGVSRLGTKALMWAVEERLKRPAGRLYQWGVAGGELPAGELADPVRLQEAGKLQQPMLIFVHGTGSSTLGSFGDLQRSDPTLWAVLEHAYPGGIYGFEHRTLSESPVDNAVQLLEQLPEGARISLVSHSRGGLVADLLCLRDFDRQIDGYRYAFPGVGNAEGREKQVRADLADAHKEHRVQLRELHKLLRSKQPVVQRYVRVASPAQGTKLASGNFDVFLSGLLTLIGAVPFFFGNPLYAAFKRVVIEVARNRTNAHLVPGIEAMLPDAPMAALLRDAPVQPGIEMALIAGDVEGGNLLVRLGVLLTDFVLFDNVDNDLVVDTGAMLGGIATKAGARVLFDRGSAVSHFRYFGNLETRHALRSWLSDPQPAANPVFQSLPARFDGLDAMAGLDRSRAGADTDRPVVVVLPGVMGSYLNVGGKDRVWFDPLDIAAGGLEKVKWDRSGIEAEALFSMFYGALCKHLAISHRVEAFAYDWRQPLDVLGERLGEFLDQLLKGTKQPVRLIAHSMGGLVVRACIYRRRPVIDALMQRDGSRLVMLGTPHQGAHSMVENLIGKGSTLRSLVRLDLKHSMQEVLDIVAGFRGALQLLPRRGFSDTFQGQSDGGDLYAIWPYDTAKTWDDLKAVNTDLWFGDNQCGTPPQDVLDAASWLWRQDNEAFKNKATPELPKEYEAKSVYVYGVAANTPCGIRLEKGRLRMVGTTRGDGTVTWDSGRIGGIGSFYYMPAAHGDLPSTAAYFGALTDLLVAGATNALMTTPPVVRAVQAQRPLSYDAGPPEATDTTSLAVAMLGGTPTRHVTPRAKRRLEVAVNAMDLRFLAQPVLVGHYEQDPIAGPELLIDTELLNGELRQRHDLGLYAGPLGTASVVLRAPNEFERKRGSLLGAVVIGLGVYDGALNVDNLRMAVRAGVLRYLLQTVDVLGPGEREVPLATLLLGYNSSNSLSVAASLEALVRGVIEANGQFAQTTGLNIRVARLDIVELYLDTAITAVYELRQLAGKLAQLAKHADTLLVCSAELVQGDGLRQRLFDNRNAGYWPRLMVTDADSSDGAELSPPRAPSTRLAGRLRYLYVGQRARAESIVQQRQPALIETLVRQQIDSTVWSEDFGRLLFQLIVPHDFKDAARQLQRVVLVVDSATANLPWELMLADPLATQGSAAHGERQPLAVRTPVVRQLSTVRFRRQVRQSVARTALVVGNPSVRGFAASFPDPRNTKGEEPPALPGAEAEAEAVARSLTALGYAVSRAIGPAQSASTVLAKLYRQPYRVLHISAHGVFDQCHVDGMRRSGVVLSGGLLITAAEIAAMESVPELVFLNCCHLGQVDDDGNAARDATVRDGNKLAASLARELIDIGVRCVIVAGWAVTDTLAQQFGQVFYQSLLQHRLPFGGAVFEARKALWATNPADITWGAFQAYGEPGWLAEPRADGAGAWADGDVQFASLDELLDQLARARAEVARRPDRQSERDKRAQLQAIDELIQRRCPPAWLAQPALQSALGATWRDFGLFEKARQALLAAVRAEDLHGRVPIRDVEQLANIEARLGERQARQLGLPAPAAADAAETVEAEAADGDDAPPVDGDDGMALIERAIGRLDMLDRLVSEAPTAAVVDAAPAGVYVNCERAALRGSAYKRKAAVYAHRLLQARAKRTRAQLRNRMLEALQQSTEAYRSAEGVPGDERFSTYNALNRLALGAFLARAGEAAEQRNAAALARQCGQALEQLAVGRANVWNAVLQPEAVLIEQLRSGDLAATGEAGELAWERVTSAYAQAVTNLAIKPWQLDSVVEQLELLSIFSDALHLADDDASRKRIADRLLALARQLQPARPQRERRPV